MNNTNLNKLTEQAKMVVNLYNTSGIKFNNIIKISSNGCISDPEELKHIENMVAVLEELKQNGNIKSYTSLRIDDQTIKFTFEC